MTSRSSASAIATARIQPRVARRRMSKTLTNCAPCSRSSGVGKAEQRAGEKAVVFSAGPEQRVQQRVERADPNSACGRSQPMPKAPRPCARADRGRRGRSWAGTACRARPAKPTDQPAAAPIRVAPRQKSAPISAGRICAMPTKAMSPIAASAAPPPETGNRDSPAQDPDDRSRRDIQHQPAHVARIARRGPRAQPERHDDVVRHHRRQRDRGATITIEVAAEKPPRKASIASPSLPHRQRHGQHEQSGFVPAGMQASPITAIGSTKRLIRKVEREGPGGGGEVALVGVLDHQHLEHARQGDDGRGREEGQPQPAPPGSPIRRWGGLDRGHARRPARRPGPRRRRRPPPAAPPASPPPRPRWR
jgi:hypothetical protein